MIRIGMIKDLVRSAVRKPVTELYPAEKRPAVDSYRGKLHWDPEACTGCGLCVRDCPAAAIELITINKEEKRYVLLLHLDRCISCGQCAYSCRFNCIRLANDEWELAELTRDGFKVLYGRPEDIAQLQLETDTEPIVESA